MSLDAWDQRWRWQKLLSLVLRQDLLIQYKQTVSGFMLAAKTPQASTSTQNNPNVTKTYKSLCVCVSACVVHVCVIAKNDHWLDNLIKNNSMKRHDLLIPPHSLAESKCFNSKSGNHVYFPITHKLYWVHKIKVMLLMNTQGPLASNVFLYMCVHHCWRFRCRCKQES